MERKAINIRDVNKKLLLHKKKPKKRNRRRAGHEAMTTTFILRWSSEIEEGRVRYRHSPDEPALNRKGTWFLMYKPLLKGVVFGD